MDSAQQASLLITVRFCVSDHGIGLSPEQMDKLFQPFVQAASSISGKFGGTGLGLSICRRLVELMHGTIGVDSELGQGATFWFTVPFEKGLSPYQQLPVENLKNMRLLIVDDEPNAREILKCYADSWGIKHNVAVSNAEEGLKRLSEAAHGGAPFDVVIVDLLLPGMDGREFAGEVLADPFLEQSQLILLTFN